MKHHGFRHIRALRAAPPLLAEEPERRAVFNAALEQSEELFAAAAVAGPAAKPLPLFYALSQAGRAISAAHRDADGWRIRGHGLSITAKPLVASTSVRVNASRDGRDAVGAVAAALASEPLSGVMTVGELVAALPEVSAPQLTGDAARAVAIAPADDGPWASMLPGARGRVLIQIATTEQLAEVLDRYTDVDGFEVEVPFEVSEHGTALVLLSWPAPPGVRTTPGTRLRAMSDVAREVNGRWYLVPRLGDAASAPPRLLIWWALLYALSSLARYEPAAWVAALNVNRSLAAVDLESVLDSAESTVPSLISDALGTSGSVPHAVMRHTLEQQLAELDQASENDAK